MFRAEVVFRIIIIYPLLAVLLFGGAKYIKILNITNYKCKDKIKIICTDKNVIFLFYSFGVSI
jgi:hypothetical protein